MKKRGLHASFVREANERAVLTALRRAGEASKADLASSVRLTQNATGVIVEDLIRRGLIQEREKRRGLRGQPAQLVRLAASGAYAIGAKIGRRTQQCLLLDFTGEVVARRDHDRTYPFPEQALALVQEDIAELRRAIPRRAASRLLGVGLALPYNSGCWRQELGVPADVCAAWNRFDFAAALADDLDVEVFIENDGTAAAAAELFYGHGRTLREFLVVHIGGAIGGGLVLEGTIHRGRTGNAGDIGLIPVAPSRLGSAPRPRGPSDILLNRASAGSLIRHVSAGGAPITLTSQIGEAMLRRPSLVDEWIEDAADALVVPLHMTASLVDLEAVIVDGLLPAVVLARLTERLRALLGEHAPEARKPPALIVGTIGREAAALGAATLPFFWNYASGAGHLTTRHAIESPSAIGAEA